MYQQQPQQGPLPGAYYGPPVPPPQPYGHYQPARRSCFRTAIMIFLGIMVALGIVVLITWLVLRPQKLEVYVDKATLTSFTLNNNNLNYSLATDISVQNPNKKIGFYYDWLQTRALYDGESFHWTQLPSFYQGHKNTTVLSPVYAGQSFVGLGDSGVRFFNSQRKAGAFDVEIRVYGGIRLKVGYKRRRYSLKIRCFLDNLRLSTNSSSPATGFTRTRCRVDY